MHERKLYKCMKLKKITKSQRKRVRGINEGKKKQEMISKVAIISIYVSTPYFSLENFLLPLLCGNLHKPHLICTEDAK